MLKVVATIRAHIRSSDILARLGGDEFVILLPDTPGEAALSLLSKLNHNLGQAMMQSGWPVSFSIGAVTYRDVPQTVDEVINPADELMYSIKNSGKNGLLHKEIGENAHG